MAGAAALWPPPVIALKPIVAVAMASANRMIPVTASQISCSWEGGATFFSIGYTSSGSRRIRDGRGAECSATVWRPGFQCLLTRHDLHRRGYEPVSNFVTSFLSA
jgi:hypothetical protein